MTGTLSAVMNCEYGIANLRDLATTSTQSSDGQSPTGVAANPLERLVQIMHANDRLMEELATIRRRIVRARDYLASPEGNRRFGVENLAFCKSKHRGVLAQLRANRIEAYQILGLDGHEKRDAS